MGGWIPTVTPSRGHCGRKWKMGEKGESSGREKRELISLGVVHKLEGRVWVNPDRKRAWSSRRRLTSTRTGAEFLVGTGRHLITVS